MGCAIYNLCYIWAVLYTGCAMYSANDGADARLSASWYGRAFNTALGPIRASTCGKAAGLYSVQPRTANKQPNKQTNKQTNKQACNRSCLVEQLAVLRAQLIELLL